MGKHFNSQAYREWERQQDRKQDDYFEAECPLTESELAEIASDKHFERVDYPRTDRQWGGMA
ncbi:hypothetical protein J2801_003621 [Paraburkholderia phenoliruptrix]|uniref:hypothetical protein n=1 Tax=Paraburkholderia phenoliruptrix TaxID=252970 RepID=UPI002860ADA4|nr:hypothetical protein [Paraburkholderia phenoliruptrix]MDR6421333.1 hypothetical protein [Paraburkholderia phenoliruptrix]